ncbi:MAG: carboxypeptidase-like regulatory domain-containing protein, partial [Pedobacter sp.]|nr:carboxypeptidase-like regulatory domain-containing protein [Pedobacter sp.]
MKPLYFILLACILSGPIKSLAQSQGKISGRISLVDGRPYGSVSVSLLEIDQTTLTNEKGNYYFNHVPAGNYTVRIQVPGAPQVDLKVNLTEGQEVKLNYQLT